MRMSRAEKSARIALAKRLRSMVPDPTEFEIIETEEDKEAASEFFVTLCIETADKLTRRI